MQHPHRLPLALSARDPEGSANAGPATARVWIRVEALPSPSTACTLTFVRSPASGAGRRLVLTGCLPGEDDVEVHLAVGEWLAIVEPAVGRPFTRRIRVEADGVVHTLSAPTLALAPPVDGSDVLHALRDLAPDGSGSSAFLRRFVHAVEFARAAGTRDPARPRPERDPRSFHALRLLHRAAGTRAGAPRGADNVVELLRARGTQDATRAERVAAARARLRRNEDPDRA